MKKYYVLSLKHSKHQYQYTWWKPNNNGYTTDIQIAGIYTEDEINNSKNYYCNTDTMPIPVELVEQSLKMVAIPTTDNNFNLFGITEHLKTAKDF